MLLLNWDNGFVMMIQYDESECLRNSILHQLGGDELKRLQWFRSKRTTDLVLNGMHSPRVEDVKNGYAAKRRPIIAGTITEALAAKADPPVNFLWLFPFVPCKVINHFNWFYGQS